METQTETRSMTLDEWQADLERRAEAMGKQTIDVGFRCVACGHVATARMFQDLGDDIQKAPVECYGRALQRHGAKPGDVGTRGKPGKKGCCNWAAYGLFQIGGMISLQTPESTENRPVLVFPFAD